MALIGQAVSEKKIFENGGQQRTDRRWTDGRTPDHGHPISSPCEPNGSGELITKAKEMKTFLYILSPSLIRNFKLLAFFCDLKAGLIQSVLETPKTITQLIFVFTAFHYLLNKVKIDRRMKTQSDLWYM